MKKFFLGLLIVLITVGGFILVTWDVPNWRLYDRQWRPLAMTHAENFCAGVLTFTSADERPEEQAECIAQHDDLDNVTPDVASSLRWGCEGLFSVSEWPVEECMEAVEGYQVWFLQHGGYTNDWAEAGSNKRPNVAAVDITKAPRGERTDETGRFGS